MALMAVACASELPPPDGMAAEAARLDAVLPVMTELRVTDFEDSAHCSNLAYARGTFGVPEQDGCEREGTGRFDAVAEADHGRLAAAIKASGVATDRILAATYEQDGDLATAWFSLVDASTRDNGHYLYDPVDVEPKRDVPGRQTFTRIADDWWFVWSVDD